MYDPRFTISIIFHIEKSCPAYVAKRINIQNGIIITIRKHIVTQDTLAGGGIGVGIDEPGYSGIIIPGLEIVEPGLSVVNIALASFALKI